MSDIPDESHPPVLSHGALFARFLKFGCLAFGGPVAQIAMIRRELIEHERWMAPAHFNRLLAVMQVLPGPEAQLCAHLGIRAKGRPGGLLAGDLLHLRGLRRRRAVGGAGDLRLGHGHRLSVEAQAGRRRDPGAGGGRRVAGFRLITRRGRVSSGRTG